MRFDDDDATFEIPIDFSDDVDLGIVKVFPNNDCHAIDFSTKASSVELVTGQTKVHDVSRAVVAAVGLWGINGSTHSSLRGGVCGIDLDFLQSKDLGPMMAFKKGTERRGGSIIRGLLGGRRCEEGGDWYLKKGSYAIDIPGEDSEARG